MLYKKLYSRKGAIFLPKAKKSQYGSLALLGFVMHRRYIKRKPPLDTMYTPCRTFYLLWVLGPLTRTAWCGMDIHTSLPSPASRRAYLLKFLKLIELKEPGESLEEDEYNYLRTRLQSKPGEAKKKTFPFLSKRTKEPPVHTVVTLVNSLLHEGTGLSRKAFKCRLWLSQRQLLHMESIQEKALDLLPSCPVAGAQELCRLAEETTYDYPFFQRLNDALKEAQEQGTPLAYLAPDGPGADRPFPTLISSLLTASSQLEVHQAYARFNRDRGEAQQLQADKKGVEELLSRLLGEDGFLLRKLADPGAYGTPRRPDKRLTPRQIPSELVGETQASPPLQAPQGKKKPKPKKPAPRRRPRLPSDGLSVVASPDKAGRWWGKLLWGLGGLAIRMLWQLLTWHPEEEEEEAFEEEQEADEKAPEDTLSLPHNRSQVAA